MTFANLFRSEFINNGFIGSHDEIPVIFNDDDEIPVLELDEEDVETMPYEK